MFKTPYSTTVCKDYVLKKVVDEIQKSIVTDGYNEIKRLDVNTLGGEVPRNIDVFLVGPGNTNVPPFAHPLFMKTSDYSEKESVLIDVRNFTRLTRENEMKVSSVLDYNLAVTRALLSGYWKEEEPDDLMSLGSVQITIFSRWITDLLTRRLALSPETQVRVTVIAAFYYLCLFREEVTMDEKEKIKFASKISQTTKIGQDLILEILDRLQQMLNIHDFVAALISTSDSERLSDLNVGLLYTIVGGSWFGSNHTEIVALSLEHPPTFISLIATAMRERGYRKTVLGRTVELNTKRGEDKAFLHNLYRLPV